MTRARIALAGLLLLGCTGPGPRPTASAPPPDPTTDPPSTPTPGAPADLTPPAPNDPSAEFWKLGQAACPEGATFSPSEPPYYQASCTADGVIDGPTATFDADGRLLVLERYVRGQAEGQHLAYWPNGRKQLEQSWHAGKEHGPFTRWYEGGQKAEEGAYREGRLDGPVHAWDGRGKPLPDSLLRDGTGTYTEWHASGQKARERSFVAGVEHGTRREWHANGQRAVEAQVDRGALHGRFAAWDDAGRPLRSGSHEKGEESGPWTIHGPGGAIVRVDTYAAGDVVATITYQDGQPLGKPPADRACTTAEGLQNAFKRSTGRPLDDGGDHCVRRAVHFPGVVAIGMFAHDHGCSPGGVIVDCVYRETVDGAKILERAGWRRARPEAREQIARDYVAEVGVVWNRSGEPSVRREANGDLIVTDTVTIVGMRGASSHSQAFRFTPSGAVTPERTK